MNLAKRTFSGVLWHFAQQLVRRGINFVVTLLLAHYLLPTDFGIVAMMTVFLALGASLVDSGFKQALIRMQSASQLDFNTAFYANLFLGLMAYIVLFILAPWIADFYAEPRLIKLIRVAGLNLPINAFLVVQSANMHRDLNFKIEMQTAIPAGVISSSVAVGLAMAGFGVWALVAQMLLFSFCNTVFLWLKQGWRPSLSFGYDALRNMYGFGCKLFLAGVLDIVFKNIYIIVIAKLFTSSITGYYFFAEKVKDMVVNQLVSSIQTVTYPALVNVHEDDVRLKAGYRKIISVTTFILFPVMAFLTALAQPVFESLLPKQWLPAVFYLQILCIAGLITPINAINQNLLKVKGRSDLYLVLEIFKKIIILIVFGISIRYEMTGILIGQIISSIVIFLLNSYFSARLIDYPAWQQVLDFLGSLFLSFFVAGISYIGVCYADWSPLVELLVFGSFSIVFYLFMAYFSKIYAFSLVIEMAHTYINKKNISNLK